MAFSQIFVVDENFNLPFLVLDIQRKNKGTICVSKTLAMQRFYYLLNLIDDPFCMLIANLVSISNAVQAQVTNYWNMKYNLPNQHFSSNESHQKSLRQNYVVDLCTYSVCVEGIFGNDLRMSEPKLCYGKLHCVICNNSSAVIHTTQQTFFSLIYSPFTSILTCCTIVTQKRIFVILINMYRYHIAVWYRLLNYRF